MQQLFMMLMLSDASAVPLHDIRRLPFFLREVEYIKSLLVYSGPIPRPTKHAPLASFQRNLVPAHSEDNIVAEESSSFRHLLYGCAADIPAPNLWEQEDPELAHAVQWVAQGITTGIRSAFGLQSVVQFRESAMIAYKASAARCWPYTLQLQHEMQPHVFQIVKRFNLVFMAVCGQATGHLDTTFVDRCVSGFQVVGHMPDSFCHRRKPFAATEDATTDRHAQNKRLIASMTRRGKKATVRDIVDLKETLQATLQEVEDGWAEGPFSFADMCARFPQGFWLAHRFPHRRTPDSAVRPVDDHAKSRHNACTSGEESIACENADFPSRMATLFYSLLGGIPFGTGLDDLRKAFRQVPVEDISLNVVAVWNHDKKHVDLFVIRGSVFGAVSSVLNFNRMSRWISVHMRCMLGLVIAPYYDDFCCAEPLQTLHSAQFSFLQLITLFGPLTDPKKHVRGAVSNPFLGVVSDFSQFAAGIIIVRIKPDRKRKLIIALMGVLAKGSLTHADAASLRGKLYFMCLTCSGRVGVAALLPFVRRQYSKRTYLSQDILASVAFFLILLKHMRPRSINLLSHLRPTLKVWSDAMLQDGVGRLGFVVYDPEDGYFVCTSYLVPAWFFSLMRNANACIGQLEIAAALLVYITLPAWRLQNRRVLHFIDNTSAMYSLFKGYSSKDDSSLLVNLFHLMLARLHLDIWWEYVASKANIADLPSRDDFKLLRLLKCIFIKPMMPTLLDFLAPLSHWLPEAAHRMHPRATGAARRAAKQRRLA